jgi:hypothetical protein
MIQPSLDGADKARSLNDFEGTQRECSTRTPLTMSGLLRIGVSQLRTIKWGSRTGKHGFGLTNRPPKK